MQKTLLFIGVMLLSLPAFSQSLKPIASRVLQEKQSMGEFPKSGLFDVKMQAIQRGSELSKQWSEGLLLLPDAKQIAALRAKKQERIELTVPVPGEKPLQLELVRGNVFSPDFKVKTASNRGGSEDVDHGLHYWGIVKNRPGTLAGISIFENEIMGIISTETEKYVLGKLEKDRQNTHIMYRERDLLIQNQHQCWSEMLEDVRSDVPVERSAAGPDNCVRMYMEADYTIYQNKGSVAAATSYINGFFSQVALLYANESINIVLNELLVWDVVDPYTGPSSSQYLTQFRNAMNGNYNGDLAHLVGFTGGGGIAYLDVLCNNYYGVGYSGINTTYSNVPTYSWTVEVVTHEIGHNLGSPHTHACAWNGNNTAIDGCGPAAGYSEGCNANLPTAGTIMSYCHLVSGVGIDFNLGFGPQPGDRIRSEVYNAACLTTCGGGGGQCTYGPINSNNFESGFGIWVDGGTDCARINNATYANSPTYSIQLRDNTSTSLMSTTSQNWTAYEEITVQFSFITVSFDNSNEDFWVQLSNNGGASYTTVADFNYSTHFANGVRYTATIVIPGPFASNSRLRIRADASADDDQIYIDDVVITGCSQSLRPNDPVAEARTGDQDEENLPSIAAVKLSPNPAKDVLNIDYQIDQDGLVQVVLNDLAGRTVFQNKYQVSAGEQRVSVDLSALPAGLYMVTLSGGNQLFNEKVLVVR
ncbi:MAG: M12 family metallo-peptidase [Thermoanaerobaculia bacterium]|nr:M12 family metallo-peptidase [Thermoanaerobaculia bacterium]